MEVSKAWNWALEKSDVWKVPSEESYALAARWKEKKYRELLDFGCGLGRHTVLFARQGFHVTAFDLSETGAAHTAEWAAQENLQVDVSVADMRSLPYAERSFDCIFAYHVISHTDTAGMGRIVNELQRLLRPGGEVYLTLCSKETWSWCEAGYPRLDENTVVKTDEGPEQGIAHFFVSLDDILELMRAFELIQIRHVDECYFGGKKQTSKHYFILAKSCEQ